MGGEREPVRRSRGRPRDEVADRAVRAAAVALLIERGYTALSIESIARRAGVGKQTVYRRWPSKAVLVLEAYADQAAAALGLPEALPVRATLDAYFVRLGQVMSDPGMARAFSGLLAEAQVDPGFAVLFRQRFLEPRRTDVRGVLRRGQELGQVPADTDVDFVVDLLFSAILFRLLIGPAPPDADFARASVDTVLRGVGASG